MITSTISQQIQAALKSGDSLRASTLRLLSSSLHNEKIAKMRDLTEEEELAIVRRELKRREEAVEAYKKGGRQDLAEKEEKEAEILKEFLPEQMTELQITQIVEEEIERVGVSGPGDFGKVMGAVMERLHGKAGGSTVARVVKSKLGSK